MWHFDLENLGWVLHGWPQCDAGVVLWSLAIAANDWQPRERLSRLCTIPINGVLDQTWDTASHAMEARVLRPLTHQSIIKTTFLLYVTASGAIAGG